MTRSLFLAGLLLLLVSAPPLLLSARELAIGRSINARYTFEHIDSSEPGVYGGALRAEIGGHQVELQDNVPFRTLEPFKADTGERLPGRVTVRVDGAARPPDVQAMIRPSHKDANRYWGYVYLMRVRDREGADRLAVAQNLGDGRFRTISVFEDGEVVEDTFTYAERCSPPIRAALIRFVVPHPSGFCSDVMQVWPSLWYPVLYPWVSGAAGAVLLAISLAGRRGWRWNSLRSE
jgi:hypothetical protein